jgi:Spy/CpxP family protein refolding chaperone
MKRIALAALFAVAGMAAPIACAQDMTADVTDMQALRAAAKSDKHALVASTLNLTGAETKRFWPIYDTYQRNLDLTSRRRVVALESLLSRDASMTNLAARNVITELMAVDEAETRSRHTLRNRLMRALPPIKAARYLQLEDKLQAIRDYDVASTVPLIR